MSLLTLFEIGKSSIFANKTALGITSNNIANANTEGYNRQAAIMRIANPVEEAGVFMGRGVADVEMKRFYDMFLHRQIMTQNNHYGKSYSLGRGLSYIEEVFNEVQDLGLMNSLEGYFAAWQEVANNPEDTAQRTVLMRKAESFINMSKQMESDVSSTLKFLNDEIESVVDHINLLTGNIAKTNDRIAELEAGSAVEKAAVFRDQREQLMTELREYMDYDSVEMDDGTITIIAGRRTLVTGIESYALSTSTDAEGDRTVTSAGIDITSFINDGRLAGYVEARNFMREDTLADLRKLVAGIVKETNVLHYDGFGLDGTTNNDFFNALTVYTEDYCPDANIAATIPVATRANLTLDEYDISFLDVAGTLNYQVSDHETGAVVAGPAAYATGVPFTINGIEITITNGAGPPAIGDTFFVSPVHDAIYNFSLALTDDDINKVAAATTAAGLPGDNTKALEIVDKYKSDIAILGQSTYQDFYARIVAMIASKSKDATDSLTFNETLLITLNDNRESASGVSLDEEAANLIRYQRAYEAGARIIRIADELIETVINL
jgi:flagellar hook-associated protein 1 FlgK